MNFMNLVREKFLPPLMRFGMELHEARPANVIVCAPHVILWLFAGRDGLDVSVVRKAKDRSWYEYPLGAFIVKRSKSRPVSLLGATADCEERLKVELESYGSSLASDCPDVLGGDSAWLDEYPWEPLRVAAPMAKMLDELKLA